MKQNKLFVKIIFGVVLGILIVAFLNVGISLFYPEPEYEDHCDITTKIIEDRVVEEPPQNLEAQKECSDSFRAASNAHGRIVFFILAPIGFILLIIGTLIEKNLTIQIMLMGSGFINVVMAIMRNINDKVSIFITIGVLIIIGIAFTLKKLKDR